MGYSTNEGNIISNEENDSFFNIIQCCLNTTFAKTTTYKYGLIKTILDNLFNISSDYTIDFDTISKTFSQLYWNLVNIYELPQKIYSEQGNFAGIEKVIYQYRNKYNLKNVFYDKIPSDIKNNYLKDTKTFACKYVIGALYEEFQGKIFGFSKEQRVIYFSPDSYRFLVNNKNIIEKLNYYAWINWTEKLLEKNGQGISNLAIKLDHSIERNSLEIYKKQLLTFGDSFCFYCNKKIEKRGSHVDHFIPWCFVKNDKIWNFVLSCDNCNKKKNDRLANKDYLNKLILRNSKYLNESFSKELNELYDSALHNGFAIWDKK